MFDKDAPIDEPNEKKRCDNYSTYTYLDRVARIWSEESPPSGIRSFKWRLLTSKVRKIQTSESVIRSATKSATQVNQ